MTQDELAEFKRLLALYLAITCPHCSSSQVEDRHVITCTSCGVVLSDLRAIVESINNCV